MESYLLVALDTLVQNVDVVTSVPWGPLNVSLRGFRSHTVSVGRLPSSQ